MDEIMVLTMEASTAAHWVASMDDTTAETTDERLVGRKAVSTDKTWVAQTDASTAAHSAAR